MMLMALDWITKIVRQLKLPATVDDQAVRAAILAHHPVPPDTAYMPVPRCETCAQWVEPTEARRDLRWCRKLAMLTEPAFGCVEWTAR